MLPRNYIHHLRSFLGVQRSSLRNTQSNSLLFGLQCNSKEEILLFQYFRSFILTLLLLCKFSPGFSIHFQNIACWLGDFIFAGIFALEILCKTVVSLNSTYYLSIPYFFYNFFPVANFVCSIAIAAHQFTALFRPLKVENVSFFYSLYIKSNDLPFYGVNCGRTGSRLSFRCFFACILLPKNFRSIQHTYDTCDLCSTKENNNTNVKMMKIIFRSEV